MIKRTYKLGSTALMVAVFGVTAVHAATITTADDTDFDTYLPALIETGSETLFGFGQDDAVSLGQTVTVGATSIDVTKILLTYEIDTAKDADASTASTLTMHIFEVADPEALTITVPGTTKLTTTFDAPYVGGTDSTLIIELDGTLTLDANTSYAVWFDTSGTFGNRWEWFRTTDQGVDNNFGDVYAGGAFYDGGAIKTDGLRDASLALIPEPGTLGLISACAIGALMIRRFRV